MVLVLRQGTRWLQQPPVSDTTKLMVCWLAGWCLPSFLSMFASQHCLQQTSTAVTLGVDLLHHKPYSYIPISHSFTHVTVVNRHH